MKVILNKDIANLGEEGDIVEVKRGYARNYLIPRSLVMPYNEQALAILETHRAAIEKRKEEKRKNAMDLKTRLESESLEIAMTAGKNGKLFGSVTAATIAEALSKIGVDVEKKHINVPDNSLKTVGNYVVEIRLYGDTDAQIKVRVVPHGKPVEEAPAEAATDANVETDTETAVSAEESAGEAAEDVSADASVDASSAGSEDAGAEAQAEDAEAENAMADDSDKEEDTE